MIGSWIVHPCDHQHWLPLIVHGRLTLSICLGCGESRLT